MADHLPAEKGLVFVERRKFLSNNANFILIITDGQNESILCFFTR
jgi:hypothetical protein